MKKFLVALLVCLLSISMLFLGISCKVDTPPEEEEAVEEEAVEEEAVEEEEPYTLTLWHMQNVEAYIDAYNEIAAKFTEEHPNISFEFRTQSWADMEALLKAGALSGDLPDLFNLWAGETLFSFIENDLIVDYLPFMKADEEWWSYIGGLVESDPSGRDRDGNGFYFGPTDVYTEMVFYYKDMSEKYGLVDPPKTVSDVVANGEILMAEGILPIGTGMLDAGIFTENFGVFVAQQLGDGMATIDMYQAAQKGEISWQNDVFLNALNAIDKMNALMSPDALSLDQQVIGYERLFNKETWYEFMVGSWMTGELETQAAEEIAAGNIGIAPYPAVLDDLEPNFAMGGIGANFSLNAESPRKELAMEFVKFTESPAATGILVSHSITPAGPVDDPSKYSDSEFFADYIAATNDLNIVVYLISVNPDAHSAFLENLQNMFLGEVTPEEVLANMDEVTGQ